MKYFPGIEWVGFNHYPEFDVPICKPFPNYYVLDYNHQGNMSLQLDGGPIMHLTAPVAWFTFPEPTFKFRAARGQAWDHRHIGFRGSRVQAWLRSGLLRFDAYKGKKQGLPTAGRKERQDRAANGTELVLACLASWRFAISKEHGQ